MPAKLPSLMASILGWCTQWVCSVSNRHSTFCGMSFLKHFANNSLVSVRIGGFPSRYAGVREAQYGGGMGSENKSTKLNGIEKDTKTMSEKAIVCAWQRVDVCVCVCVQLDGCLFTIKHKKNVEEVERQKVSPSSVSLGKICFSSWFWPKVRNPNIFDNLKTIWKWFAKRTRF